MAAPVVMVMVTAATSRRGCRHSGRLQDNLVALLVDQPLLLEVVGNVTIRAHVLESVIASQNVIANMLHANFEVVAGISVHVLCIEESKIVTEPYSSETHSSQAL